PKEIMGINKVTMVGDLNKGIMEISKETTEEGPRKKIMGTSKVTMEEDLNKRIGATNKEMKRRINRIWK
ncbi:TPA: FMRFamide neuropeptide, partial [Bacillus cereus]